MANICGFALFIALSLTVQNTSGASGGEQKIRQKREWIIPPRKLRENFDYTHKEFIAKIRSDEETRTSIEYSLTGHGADQPPIGLFYVGKKDGMVKIRGVLDREQTPVYYLQGVAKYPNGSYAEKNINLRIVVEDENDCTPEFKLTIGAVHELSSTDTFVMTITASDADEEGTLNSKIAYSIVEQSHDGMFYINRNTGSIYVRRNTLDREKKDKYTLTIKGTDMDGAVYGNTGTGQAVINILDVNDNIPILEKNIYECSVEENIIQAEVVRIQVIDYDLIHTDNWLAVFTIVSGNEAGYFSITTDIKTNEGILALKKELDYEELKEVRLEVYVANKAQYHSSVVITKSKTYTIKVNVINQPEGPRFKPAVKVITVSEESSSVILNKVITNYAAIDSDTLLIATNVRYAKGQDFDNWLIIDETTADIKLNKIPDFESTFLINHTYYAHIICITNEIPAKTATGTIAIQVKDFNDHCPVLVQQSQRLCYEEQVVYVTAVDKDRFPNGAPFGFKVDTRKTKDSWRVEHLNETTAIFRSTKTLWPGMHQLFVDVWDQQGKICGGQLLQIQVCACDASKVCIPEKAVIHFGASGVLLMLLGLLLLLLLPLLLLFCICGKAAAAADFKPIPFDTKDYLIAYNTEGQGEDKEMALLHISKDQDENNWTNVCTVTGVKKDSDGRHVSMIGGGAHWSNYNQYEHHGAFHHHSNLIDGDYINALRKEEYSRFDHSTFDGLALSEAFLGSYYFQKTTQLDKTQKMGDSVKVYEYEGEESFKGSFEDICGEMHEDDDLAFLDNLDLKFKTLAEICSGSKIEREVSTTVHVTSKPAVSTAQKQVSLQDTVSLTQSQEKQSSSTSILMTGAHQSSGVASSAGAYYHEKVVVPNTTLFVQQPALYYTQATPVYVMEPHPTLLVTPTPVLGIQDNLLVEEKKKTKISDAGHRGAKTSETQHYQSLVLVEKQPSVQAQGGVSGSLQIVNTETVQSMGAHGVKQVIRPSRGAMAGGIRDREAASLEIRAPQSVSSVLKSTSITSRTCESTSTYC